MYHIFFIHASIGWHLTHFHVLAIVNTAEMSIGVAISFELQFSPDIYLEGGLLDHYFSSVVQSYPTLCDPMDMTDFTVHHQLLELAQMYVHRVSDIMNHLVFCCPLLLLPSIFPNLRIFSNEWKKLGASASTSVFPMNIQDWLPLQLTGLISL